jgi:hypothetical protein
MELHQYTLNDSLFGSLAVYFVEQLYGVDALNQGGTQAQELAHFVGLQMADEVPAELFAAELRNLLGKLLNATFAKEALTGLGGLAQGFDRVELRDGNELNARRQIAADGVET